MKLLNSEIFNLFNRLLDTVQSKTNIIRRQSFILSNIDKFILLSIFMTFFVSVNSSTSIIGIVSFIFPCLVVLKVLMTKGEKIDIELNNFFLLLYLLICLISNFTSSMIGASLYGYMKTLIYFAFYFAMCQFLKNNKKYIFPILLVIGGLITFEGVVGLFQNYVGVEQIATWQDVSYVNPEDVLKRVYGTLLPYNPNLYAAYMTAGIPALMGLCALFFGKRNLIGAVISLFAFVLSLYAVFLSGCRGSYIALFFMFIVLIFASYKIVFSDLKIEKLKNIWKNVVIAGLVGGVTFLAVNQSILKRILSIFILRGDSSTSFRMNVYNSAIQMFCDNPVFGIGVGNKVFREIYGLYMLSGFDALSCYCVFLETAVESGIFALIFFLLFLGVLFVSFVKKFAKEKEYNKKIIMLISFIAVFAVMVHGLADTVFYRPQVQYVFWTMAAILTVMLRNDDKQ